MKITFDTVKAARNFEKHGLRFDAVRDLDWETALVRIDRRHDYGETRKQAFVRDHRGKAFVVVYVRRGDTYRIISFRRAHEKERTLFDV